MKQSAAESRIEHIAARYFAIADEINKLRREEEVLKDTLTEWLEDNPDDVIELEGLGSIHFRESKIRNYDAYAIHEQDPVLFNRLLELRVLDVNRTRLDSQQIFIGVKVPMQEGVSRQVYRDRNKR